VSARTPAEIAGAAAEEIRALNHALYESISRAHGGLGHIGTQDGAA
jgi:hypothetical protein